jgi:adenylyl cyclase-associated protein
MQSVVQAADAFAAAGEKLGGEAATISASFRAGIRAQQAFVAKAATMAKPQGDALQQLLAPISEEMTKIDGLTSTRSALAQHVKMVNEAAQSFGWVLEAKPAPVVAEAGAAATFVGNKLLAAHKGDAAHTDFVKALQQVMKELEAYVKANHATGVSWKSGAAAAPAASAAAPATQAGAADFSHVSQAADAFAAAGEKLGGEATTISASFRAGIRAQEAFVAKAATMAKPQGDALQQLLAPISEEMTKIDGLTSTRSALAQHVKMVNEAAQSFGWVLEAKPAPVVAEAGAAATFVGNKLLAAHKGDAAHTDFVKALQQVMKELEAYVKANHATGVSWNKGSNTAPPQAPKAAPPTGKMPPPPPPPPPPPAGTAKGTDASGTAALFAEIKARGDNITQSLRHVSDDQKVYKKPREDTGPVSDSKAKATTGKAGWMPKPGQARSDLIGDKKWAIECHRGTSDDFKRVELSPQKRHVVNIYRCVDTLIVITGQCNSIQVIECLNTHVVIDGSVGPVEVSNSERIELLLQKPTPSVIFSTVNVAAVHIADESMLEATEFVTSCTSNVNVVLEFTEEKDEVPLHDQFETCIVGNKAQTKPVEHSNSG